jgi:hypothetical protein
MERNQNFELPKHLLNGRGLPRSRAERLLVIRCRAQEGFYDTRRVHLAVAEAFLDPTLARRAGEQAFLGGSD